MELGWTMLLLIPKVNVDTWVIGVLEVVCKKLEVVIDTGLKR